MTGSTRTPRPRAGWAAIALACLTLGVAPAAASGVENDAEARLLQAEILELSRGDLDGAMAIYRDLVADESAGDAVRAKALLQLAGCHRKRGELEVARQLLQRLVDQHAQHSDLIRVAQGYLREIEQGRSDNPTFDWIEELLASPEIQAQIFEHAMALAGRGDTADVARQQLLALGDLAVPALDRLVETTQSASHRANLAELLFLMGHYDHLEIVLRHEGQWRSLPHAVSKLSVPERKRLLASLDAIARDDVTAEPLSALRLACGATDALDRDLALTLAARRRQPQGFPTLSVLTNESHVALQALRRIEGDSSKAAMSLQYHLVGKLLQEQPEDVSLDLLTSISEQQLVENYFPRLEALGRIEDIVTLYAAAVAPRYPNLGSDLTPRTRARAYRRAGDLVRLLEVSFEHPETLDVAVDGLRSRSEIAPDVESTVIEHGEWIPEECFVRLAPLLGDPDVHTVRIVAHTLGYAPPGRGPEILPQLLDLLQKPDLPVEVEGELWSTVFRRMVAGWDSWRDELERLESLWAQRRTRETSWPGGGYPDLIPSRQVESLPINQRARIDVEGIGKTRRGWPRVGPAPLSFIVTSRYSGQDQQAVKEFLPTLIPHFAAGESPTIFATLFWVVQRNGRESFTEIRDQLLEALESMRPKNPATRAEVLSLFAVSYNSPRGSSPAVPDRPHGYLKELIEDRGLPAATKAQMLYTLANARHAEFLETLDWAKLLSDPELRPLLYQQRVADWVLRYEERRLEFINIAMEDSAGLPWAIRNVSASSGRYVDILERGLQSDEPWVRTLARTRILEGETTTILRFLWRLTADGTLERDTRVAAIDRLVYLADAASIPHLTELLDDSDFTVRAKALAALESIRETLKKQSEWRERNAGRGGL